MLIIKRIVIDDINSLSVSIGKKMFVMGRLQDLKCAPSPLQFRILKFLLDNKDKDICQSDIESSLKIGKATISAVIFTMEKNGLILRVSSKSDGRVKNIKLTDNSLIRFNEMRLMVENLNEALVRDISEDDLTTFLLVLEKMKLNLEKIDD